MGEYDPFNPEQLRIIPEQQAKKGAAPKPKQNRQHRGKFVRVPVLWFEQLSSIAAYGVTCRVALHLLHEAWRTDSRTVKLTNAALRKIGIGRQGKARALAQLRKAGLIAVEQQQGRNPVVTVRFRD
jgi:hypothetical protein